MKRNIFKILPLLFLSATIFAGCQGNKIVKEDMAGQTAPADQTQTADKQAELVPEDKTVSEAVVSEDLKGNGSVSSTNLGGKFASLTPGGDDLTKKAEENGSLYTIYFDYDMYTIREQDSTNLGKNAKWLGINPAVKVRIEGHADERGETEYNLALGDKRAKSIRQYLEDLGIKADRLDVVSYGEEKPAVPGHDEEAWAKNRRAEFLIFNN